MRRKKRNKSESPGVIQPSENKTHKRLTHKLFQQYKCLVLTLTGVLTGERNVAGAETHRRRAKVKRKTFALDASHRSRKACCSARIKTGCASEIDQLRSSESRPTKVGPRCRERNRRWRKSHHNKNQLALCFNARKVREIDPCRPKITNRLSMLRYINR